MEKDTQNNQQKRETAPPLVLFALRSGWIEQFHNISIEELRKRKAKEQSSKE